MASCSTSADALLKPEPTATQSQQISAIRGRVSWISDLQPSAEVTPFRVELRSLNGEALTTLDQLHPNTNYSLVIKGERPTRYALKTTSGFTVTAPQQGQSLHQLDAATEFVIPIHTDADTSTPLFISLVPVHAQNHTLTKEKPKSFLLPAQ